MFWVSDSGMSSNGATNSVDVTEGVCGDESWTQKNPQLHLGHFQDAKPNSLHSLAWFISTAFFSVPLAADEADVVIFAWLGCAAAGIPLETDLNIWVEGIRSRFLGQRSTHWGIDSDDNVVSNEVSKLIVSVEGKIVGTGNAQADSMVDVRVFSQRSYSYLVMVVGGSS